MIVARTAEGNPIGASVTNSNVILIKDGKRTAIPIPKVGETIPIHETSTDTYLIVKNENGKVSITTSETPDLPGVKVYTQNRNAQLEGNGEPARRKPEIAKPSIKMGIDIPAGFRDYGQKVMGHRAIINSDNVVMYETKNGWKRLN
jgi:hypothetical protein